jgi:hypothetical protein
MRSGTPTAGLDFFRLLNENEEFCAQLGKSALAASRLEAELERYLATGGATPKKKHATLGDLLKVMKTAGLEERMQPALEMLIKQRNYLSHNIYRLFAGSIEETILPRSELLDSDVECFTERAWQPADNLNGLADSIAKRILSATGRST